MTTKHIAEIYFQGRFEAAKKRLQKLKTAKFVSTRQRRVNEPAIFFLSPRGMAALKENGLLSNYPSIAHFRRSNVSERTLRHEMDVMDVKAALHVALREDPLISIAKFSTWPLLHQFDVHHPEKGKLTLKPDGFLVLRETKPSGVSRNHFFFLEVDRSTEPLSTISSKATCYLSHYRTGKFAQSLGMPQEEFRKYPFRVLFVCKSKERRDSIAKHLIQGTNPIRSMVMLTTHEEVCHDLLGKIWITPAEPEKCQSPFNFPE